MWCSEPARVSLVSLGRVFVPGPRVCECAVPLSLGVKLVCTVRRTQSWQKVGCRPHRATFKAFVKILKVYLI